MNLKWLKIGSILSLIWSLAGLGAYVAQANMDLAELARSDPYQAHMFAQMPPWAWTAYALAVWTELAGAVLLLAKRKASTALFAVSLVAVLIQFSYAFFLTDLLSVKGLGAAIFPIIIIVLAVAQLWLAFAASRSGLLR
jgi:hypothetical protein